MSRRSKDASSQDHQAKDDISRTQNAQDFVIDGRGIGDYRFSATNMMLGLDPMILKARMRQETVDKARKDAQRAEVATQTADTSPPEPVDNAHDEDSGTKTQDESDASSEAPTPSESGPKSSAPDSSSIADEPIDDSSQDPIDAISASYPTSTSEPEPETAIKSVSFAEGTSSPAASPPASSTGHPVVLCDDDGDNPWTMSENAMVLGMKEQGAGWDLIASSIQRTRAQVRKRYYELKCNRANAEADEQDEASVPSASTVMEPRPIPAARPNIASPLDTLPGREVGLTDDEDQESDDEGYYNDGEEESDGEEDDESDDDDDDEHSPSYSSSQASSDEAEDDQASSTNEILDLLREDSSSASSLTDEADGYDASDYDPLADHADPIAYERERRRKERYIHASLYKGLLPPRSGDPFVSQGFSRRDRALLADLDDRRLASQWLEMQANFFNVTGRMVPLHLIKAKLENRSPSEAEIGCLARGERKVANWTEALALLDVRELLDPTQARDAPADALRCGSDDEGAKGSVSDDE